MLLKHQFDLNQLGSKHACPGGTRILLSSLSMRSLKGIAIASLSLKKGGLREPHWHPNANELAYCISGKALVTMFGPNNTRDTFTFEEGELVYFPRGYLHHIENISKGESRFLLAYDHEQPEDLDLSASVESMSSHVLSSTFNAGETFFEKIKKQKDAFIAKRKTLAKPLFSSVTSSNKFNLEKLPPQLATSGGSVRMAHQINFPQLAHLALFSLRLFKKGVREPHWHPNASELNYVIAGKGRIVLLSPGGKIDTFEIHAGQGSIIPAGYFHSIENSGPGELRMAVYFNHAMPSDIGLSGALSSYSKETLGSIFGIDPKFFAKMHHFSENRMIVSGGA